MIDLSDYIYDVTDADTILLRRAWLKQNIPLIGPAVGAVQRHFMNLARTLTGLDFGFSVRVANIDAPEISHHNMGGNWLGPQRGGYEATDLMERLMRGGFLQRMTGGRATAIRLAPGETFGRYVGTPVAGSMDIAGELVRGGGAISLALQGQSPRYLAQEYEARSRSEGIWQYPEYEGVIAAQEHHLAPVMSHVQKRSFIGRSLKTAAAYSLMVFARNPQMHAVRDQYAQNMYVRGF